MKQSLHYIELILVAITYVILARVGQLFAIDPGNITPLWFPSGVMVAWTLLRGSYIWPGVFIGAFSGNIWAYFSADSLSIAISSIAAASFNGVGDVVACVILAELVCSKCKTRNPFNRSRHLLWFVTLCVFAGPFISSALGVGGLVIFSFIPFEDILNSMGVWLFGDALGVLIFTPMVITWCLPSRIQYSKELLGLILLASYASLITGLYFELITVPVTLESIALLGVPIALYGFLYYGQRVAFTVLLAVGAVSIIATVNGKGPYAQEALANAIMQLQFFLGIFGLCIYVTGVFLSSKEEVTLNLVKKKAELETLYRRDQLTNTWNRYRITEFLEYELSRFNRYGSTFGLILFDIDDFKKINDSLGHPEGDKLLVELCDLVSSHTRQVDLFGRWGGEEFVIVVVDTEKSELVELSNKICNLIANHQFGLGDKVTVSVGATMVSKGDTVLSLFDRVDDALYCSKREGKNKVTVS